MRNDAVPELMLNLTSSTETNIANFNIGTIESAETSGKVKDVSTGLNEDNDDGSFSKTDIVREGVHGNSCSTPKTSKKRAILESVTRKKI